MQALSGRPVLHCLFNTEVHKRSRVNEFDLGLTKCFDVKIHCLRRMIEYRFALGDGFISDLRVKGGTEYGELVQAAACPRLSK